MSDVTLSLVSHTNVGKTTLARTLLRRDVGAVFDQSHVTDVSEAHDLLAHDEHVLRLWDTPGFGDTARLVSRLRREGGAVGWLLHQVWDRFRDRALFCSQEAVRNVRDEADAVLYLVNAAEDPEDAGYVGPELDVLSWIGRPVVLVLNQTGGRDEPLRTDAWKRLADEREIVRDVLPLDAFARCWVQEGMLLDRTAGVLPVGEKQDAMRELAAAWRERDLATFEKAVGLLAAYLAEAAAAREPFTDGRSGKRAAEAALERMATSLEAATATLMRDLVELHGLSGESVEQLTATLDDVVGPPDKEQPKPGLWAVIGAAAGGALTGLGADIMSGGLSLGGGFLLGGLLGALGGSAAAKGVELVRDQGERAVRWSPAFLGGLLEQTLLRYLAVAHFGRGRGDFTRVEEPAWWQQAIARATTRDTATIAERLAKGGAATSADELAPLVRDVLTRVLRDRYPGGALGG